MDTIQDILKRQLEEAHDSTAGIIDDREEIDRQAAEEARQKKLDNYLSREEAKQLKQGDPRKNTTAYYIYNVLDKDIEETKESTIKTGFKQFDDLTGGIMPGLYLLGASPSIGKTTFCLHLADLIAAQEKQVLYFSLEQSRRELVIKSLNRFADESTTREEIETDTAKRKASIEKYLASVGDRIQIFDGTAARQYKNIHYHIINNLEKKPFIIIDYLQIIELDRYTQDGDGKTITSKGNVKEDLKAITSDLATIAHNHGITIIVISSFNRGNYYMPVNLGAFKESGDIEYSADVAIGIQLDIFDTEYIDKETSKQILATDEAKAQDPRPVLIKVLKNRNSRLGSVKFNYHTSKDLFIEAPQPHKQKKAGRS